MKMPEAELLAFDELLMNHSELRGVITFIQACCTSSIFEACQKINPAVSE